MLRPLGGPPLVLRDRRAQPVHFQASPAVRLESGVPVVSSSRGRRRLSSSRRGQGAGSSAPRAATSTSSRAAAAAALLPSHYGELLFVYSPASSGHAAASISGGAVGVRAGRAWAAALVCPQALRTLPEGARRFIAGGISGEAAAVHGWGGVHGFWRVWHLT